MKARAALLLVCLPFLPARSGAASGEKSTPPVLAAEHRNAAGTFVLRTPEGWTVVSTPGEPEITEARGDGLLVRVLFRPGELGLDSLHVQCMATRLAGPMETSPEVNYEYDFIGGMVGGRRALDSAFAVRYDQPVEGHRDWRQRNLTIVGEGESLCVIAHAPKATWKKSKPARLLLTSVVESIRFELWP